VTEIQTAHAIISYFQKVFKQKFDTTPVVNRNKVVNLIINILKDLSVKEVKELIDFYVKTDKNPRLIYFCYEYDEVQIAMESEHKDLDKRKALIKQTQKNVEEFRRRYGQSTD
jgi:hypothetical protein